MKIPLLLSLIAVVVSFAEGSSSPAKACTSLQSAHPELTFFPNQTTYKQDNEG